MFTATPFASSESIAAFLDGLLAEQEQAATHERRAHPRGCLFGFLDVQPLNDALKPVDEPFMVAVRDISQGGLSFLHDSPPTVRYFAVTLTAASGKELCAPPVEVVRCRPQEALVNIACRFLSQ